MKEMDWRLLSFGFSFFGYSISDIKYWVTFATSFRHYFLSVHQSSCYKLYVYFRNFSDTTITEMSPVKRNEKITLENCGTKTRRKIFWRYMRCSTGTLHFTQSPNLSTTSQTLLALILQFSQLAVETWLHPSLTIFRGFWTIVHSWKLENISLQVTSYNAPFMQFSPELTTQKSS